MPTTPLYALRYPVASDSADVPRDIGNLATDVDNNINKPPAGILNGETQVWNGSAWARSSVTKLSGYFDLTNTGNQVAVGSLTVTKANSTLAFAVRNTGDSVDRWNIDTNGSMTWGSGSVAADLNLYRGGAAYLSTDMDFGVRASGPNRILLRDNAGRAEITFGSGADAYIYRGSASWGVHLRTNTNFVSDSVICSSGSLGLLSGAIIEGGNTYNGGNNWIAGILGASIYWDGANWINKSFGGNNGWACWGIRGAGSGLDLYVDGGTGGGDRNYTSAQFIAQRALGIDGQGNIVSNGNFFGAASQPAGHAATAETPDARYKYTRYTWTSGTAGTINPPVNAPGAGQSGTIVIAIRNAGGSTINVTWSTAANGFGSPGVGVVTAGQQFWSLFVWSAATQKWQNVTFQQEV